MPLGEQHMLGRCWCGGFHHTTVAQPHWMSTWDEPERTTSYEGRHRSE